MKEFIQWEWVITVNMFGGMSRTRSVVMMWRATGGDTYENLGGVLGVSCKL